MYDFKQQIFKKKVKLHDKIPYNVSRNTETEKLSA